MAIPVWFRGFTARDTPATRGKPNESRLRVPRADNDVTSTNPQAGCRKKWDGVVLPRGWGGALVP